MSFPIEVQDPPYKNGNPFLTLESRFSFSSNLEEINQQSRALFFAGIFATYFPFYLFDPLLHFVNANIVLLGFGIDRNEEDQICTVDCIIDAKASALASSR